MSGVGVVGRAPSSSSRLRPACVGATRISLFALASLLLLWTAGCSGTTTRPEERLDSTLLQVHYEMEDPELSLAEVEIFASGRVVLSYPGKVVYWGELSGDDLEGLVRLLDSAAFRKAVAAAPDAELQLDSPPVIDLWVPRQGPEGFGMRTLTTEIPADLVPDLAQVDECLAAVFSRVYTFKLVDAIQDEGYEDEEEEDPSGTEPDDSLVLAAVHI